MRIWSRPALGRWAFTSGILAMAVLQFGIAAAVQYRTGGMLDRALATLVLFVPLAVIVDLLRRPRHRASAPPGHRAR